MWQSMRLELESNQIQSTVLYHFYEEKNVTEVSSVLDLVFISFCFWYYKNHNYLEKYMKTYQKVRFIYFSAMLSKKLSKILSSHRHIDHSEKLLPVRERRLWNQNSCHEKLHEKGIGVFTLMSHKLCGISYAANDWWLKNKFPQLIANYFSYFSLRVFNFKNCPRRVADKLWKLTEFDKDHSATLSGKVFHQSGILEETLIRLSWSNEISTP